MCIRKIEDTQLIKTILVCIITLTIAIVIIVLTAIRYKHIKDGPSSCQTFLFDASNFFEPLCQLCA